MINAPVVQGCLPLLGWLRAYKFPALEIIKS